MRVQLRVVAEADARIDGGRDIAGLGGGAQTGVAEGLGRIMEFQARRHGRMSASDSTAWIDAPT